MCTGHDYSPPGKPKIDWEDPEAKDALVSALVNDANALVEALRAVTWMSRPPRRWRCWPWSPGRTSSRPRGLTADGRWRIARKVAEDRVVSTVDPEARHTRKSPEARRDGYRAHLAADPETGIITDEKLTKAAGQDNSDPAMAEHFLAPRPPADSGGPAPAGQPRSRGQQDAATSVTATSLPGTATPRTGPGTCARRSARPGTGR